MDNTLSFRQKDTADELDVIINQELLGYIKKEDNGFYCFYLPNADFAEIELCSRDLNDLKVQIAQKYSVVNS